MVKSLSTEARMMSVAGDWRDEGDGVEVRHLGTRDMLDPVGSCSSSSDSGGGGWLEGFVVIRT